jgi:uncharacterized membrane protein HdeD (DUF308 family)
MDRAADSTREADAGGDVPASVAGLEVPWWLVLLQGIAAVFIGLLLVTQPGATLFTLVVFLGVYWLVGGIFDLVGIFLDRTNWGWKLFTAILGILAGLLVVRNPLWATIALPATLVWLLATIGIVVGVVGIYRALTGAGWGAGILGAMSVTLGIILVLNPLISLAVLVYFAGFWAVLGGIATIAGAFWLRSNRRSTASAPPVLRDL